MTRFGDLLQSQALIDDLHLAGHQVDLVCLENFASAAPLLRHVRRVLPLPGAALLAKIHGHWPQALEILENFGRRFREESDAQCVFNITPGTPPRVLARYLAQGPTASAQPKQMLGLGLDRFGYGQDHGIWASFVSVAAHKRSHSPFNLADMWRMMAAPLESARAGSFRLASPDGQAVRWARDFLASAPDGARGYVAVQLGASEARRRWPVDNFCQLGEGLWHEARLCPILVGTGGESSLGVEYGRRATHPHVNAIGQSTIPQLAALLTQTRLLVTNDTGTMHLASGLGIPSLAFFLATAQPWDTGPMLPDCCCLEPALPCHPCAFGSGCAEEERCRTHISAATASQLALSWLESGRWNADGITDARVWRTGVDSGGFHQLEPLSANAYTGPGAWHRWWRVFWRQLFDNMTGNASPTASAFNQLPLVDAHCCAPALTQGAKLLRTIAELGTAAQMRPAAMGKIFLRNCERLQELWSSQPGTTALGAFWHEFRSNQVGELENFARQCLVMAQNVEGMAQALQQQA